jgi:hypothetical protein
MSQPHFPRRSQSLLAAAMVATLGAGCGAPAAPSQLAAPSAALGPRPSSPAKVEILQPTSNAALTGTTLHVVLKLTGATIVQATTTTIKPDEGHVHLYVNNILVSMNYGLEQDIQVQPGSIDLKAEFVAADHYPFNPRVWSQDVVITVRS